MSKDLEAELKRLRDENQNLRKSFDEIAALQEITGKIATAQNIPEMMESLLDRIAGVVQYEGCRIFLRDHKQENQLVLFKERFTRTDRPFSEVDKAIFQWAASRQHLTLLPQEENTGSIIVVPLMVHENLQGVITIYLALSEDEFTQQKDIILSILTSHTAIALENYAIHSELEEKATTVSNMKKYVDFVLESMMHGLITVNKTGEVMVFNKKAENLFGIKSSLALGNNYQIIFPQALKDNFDMLFDRTLKEGHIIDHEIQLARDDQTITVSISTTILREETNNIIGITAICRNLSLSKEIIRLREIDKIKNDFISMISHELRTPLSSIMACAETLKDGIIESREEKQEFYTLIFNEACRLNNIVNDVLDFSKIESGKMKLLLEDCNINDIIENCVSNNRQLILNSGLEVVKELDPSIPVIRVDRERMMQVIINVLSNAIKFTQKGGRIILKSSLDPDKNEILVGISDTGIGIKQEDFSKVFDKFIQVEDVMHHSKGTGLGMPISKELMAAHNGKIWFESEYNKGTTFYFSLPVSGTP